jgi:hypothetical protein
MTPITTVSTLSEKSADISKWFDELVSSIRVQEMQIVTGNARLSGANCFLSTDSLFL